ncbi:unnamed protein product, partial [Laminaria digitata]
AAGLAIYPIHRHDTGESMPELDAWINFSATLQYWVQNMATLGGLPHQQSDLHNLLAQFWVTSTPKKWSSFLGVGLLGAASDGNQEGVKQLLLAGANVRQRDEQGLNPLHRASLAGHADVVRELLADKGELSLGHLQTPSTGGIPSSVSGFPPPTGGMLPSGGGGLSASVGGLPPIRGVLPPGGGGLSASVGGLPPMRGLPSSGAGQLLRGAPSLSSQYSTLSWKPSKDGPRLEPSVSFLTKTIVNARDSVGSSPLHLAAARGNTDVVEVLLRNGADGSAVDGQQRTPLHTAAACAVGNGVGSIVLLTQAGADVMARDEVGRTSLHDAACEGAEAAISVLVQAGAETGAKGSVCSHTPLHEACARLREGSVKRLLDLGADEGAVDDDGRTPGDMVGEWIGLGEVAEPGADASIRGWLAAAPKNRTWRGRRLLVLIRWRKRTVE